MSDIRTGMDVFNKINTPNRQFKLGIKGKPISYSNDYTCMYVGIDTTNLEDEEGNISLTKGKSVKLIPAVSVDPKRGYKVLVDINPALYEYGDVSCVRIIEGESGDQATVYIKLRKALDVTQLQYLVRLYAAGY